MDKFVQRVEDNVFTDSMLEEVHANHLLWLRNTSRQEKIRCQRDTQTIFIRTAKKPVPVEVESSDVRASNWTRMSKQFPVLSQWAEEFAVRVGGDLGRVFLVRLKPKGRVYKHVDQGSYYECRDRYHLLLQCDGESQLVCGDTSCRVAAGEVWWLNNSVAYEETNTGSDWRIHVIIDVLPTPRRPRPDSEWKHFQYIRNVDTAEMLVDLKQQGESAWGENTRRQRSIRVQRETSSIPLRSSLSSRPPGVRNNDMHPSESTSLAVHFPAIYGWASEFARETGGDLARLSIVRLNPFSQVYPHIDEGEYYRARDRYHLVLQSKGGSEMICGDERVVFRERELWWFDNKAIHEARNNTDEGRVHVIFDVQPHQRSGELWMGLGDRANYQ
ncbi:Aspartyl/Asparaginyl beta-hydroxylase [Rubripirellula lacrimiformis]|uniref:Aspartyl/Asparaginyl beta-hydroxylase n=1 Tax=Rubripirellula lacrimiformis TaxID=1930273 RepID=A0A517NIS0_9BACT|nr:aspartyl/asparaginyl beta-hydroxylase domain-containing protein [Rubripirellula lacrimiformis]QDT07029.1 Aspartyl/Asparaginyl beta-hydroxylase [Rubripirellula lacrimiformis]